MTALQPGRRPRLIPRSWPRRRWVTAAFLTPPLAALYVSAGGRDLWWAWPLAAVSGAVAALIFASYVPFPGSRSVVEIGCSPCAAVAGATVLGSLLLRSTAPRDLGIAIVAVVMLGFGLVQRLDAGTGCAVGEQA